MSAARINHLETVARPITAHDIAERTAEQTRAFEDQHAKLFIKCAGLCHNETRLCPCPGACIDQSLEGCAVEEDDATESETSEDANRIFYAVVVCCLVVLAIMAFSALVE